MAAMKGATMKTLVTGIALATVTHALGIALAMVLVSHAFAANATEVTDCPHIVWQNGHYVCGLGDND